MADCGVAKLSPCSCVGDGVGAIVRSTKTRGLPGVGASVGAGATVGAAVSDVVVGDFVGVCV